MVTFEDHLDSNAEKLAMLQKASKAPLFIADLREVNDDFGAIEKDIV